MTSTYHPQQWNDETVDRAAHQRYTRPGSDPMATAAPLAAFSVPVGRIRHIDQGRFWVGAVLTSTVAALGGVIGLVVARDLLQIPISGAPFSSGPVHIASYGLLAGIIAMLAATVYAGLLAFAPRPTVYFGALGGLITTLAGLLPFTVHAPIGGQIGLATVNVAVGMLILSLIPVAASNVGPQL